MDNNLAKKQLLMVVLIFGLLISLIVTLYLVKQSQDIRNRAATTGVIGLNLITNPNPVQKGNTTTVTLTMFNRTGSPINFRIAGIKMQFDKNVADFLGQVDIFCNQAVLSDKAAISPLPNEINILQFLCLKKGGEAYKLDPSTTIELGHIAVKIKSDSSVNSVRLTLKQTRIPVSDNGGNYIDMSYGEGGYTDINILSIPTPTPTSTPCGDVNMPCCPGSICHGTLACTNNICQQSAPQEPTAEPIASPAPPNEPPLTECFQGICPNGCCSGYTCNLGDSDTACGSGGATCVDCASIGQSCVNKTCQWVEPTVGPLATESPPHPPLAP